MMMSLKRRVCPPDRNHRRAINHHENRAMKALNSYGNSSPSP